LKNSLFQKKGSRQTCQRAYSKPAIAGILLLILGAIVIPACAAETAPVAAFISNVSDGSVPLNVKFIDSSTNSPTSWAWSFGDGGTSTERSPVHTYTTAGTYTVTLTASNGAGVDTVTRSGYITVSTAAIIPVAMFQANATSGNIPLSVQFLDSSTNSPTSWAWSFGDGGTSTEQSPVHTYTTAGTFTVTLTATNTGGSNTVTKAGEIVVGSVSTRPVASFISTVESGNAPLAVQFVDSSTNTPTSWVWSFGDGNTSAAQNPSHTYVIEGTYTVTLTATNSGGSDTETKAGYITVTFTKPTANFTANVTSGTAPFAVQFNDTSDNSPTIWSWKFGDGGKATEQNPVHVFKDAGTYAASLTAENSAGKDTVKKTDYISVAAVSAPIASFTANTTSGKAPLTVRFNDTSSYNPTSWLWSFGDSSTSTEKNPTHTFTDMGTYTVSLTAANEAGNSFRTVTITADGTAPTTVRTTIPVGDQTPKETTAVVTAVQTTAPAASASGSSSFTYIIAAIVALVAIGAGFLYLRNRGGGGHHRGGSQL
jgi:PKD repeat protein